MEKPKEESEEGTQYHRANEEPSGLRHTDENHENDADGYHQADGMCRENSDAGRSVWLDGGLIKNWFRGVARACMAFP